MRPSNLLLVLAGATAVASSPLRVIVTNVRVGTPLEAADAGPVAHYVPFEPVAHNGTIHQGGHHGCGLFRGKALALTNKFREMFGFEPIKPQAHAHAHSFPFIGTPMELPQNTKPQVDMMKANTGHLVHILPVPVQPIQGSPHQGMRDQRYIAHTSFVRRIHRALMALGPWEGRAVAFVLGCGIGVLLRMFWVMTVVIVRAFNTVNSDRDEYEAFLATAQVVEVAPPAYDDEKRADVAVGPVDDKAPTN